MNQLTTVQSVKQLAEDALGNLKAKDVVSIDVKKKSSFADFIIVASGTSDRHLNAMANQVYLDAKKANIQGIAIEGKNSKQWILVDLGDVIVHLMSPETRELYEIEKLWQVEPSLRE